ncbi:MAG: HPr family phosphocarrier protein [Clostridia bacterium]|nr:HPr family phosphocarrier protein [Clostridia bacterium]
MTEFQYTITDREGIHARPAGQLVKEAAKFQSVVTIHKGEKSGDAKRIFAVMGLAVKCGDEIRVCADGADEAAAAATLETFLKENL